MFGWTKGRKKLLEDTEINTDNVNPNNDKERKFTTKIINDTMNAESVKGGSEDETLDLGIEDVWEDEYKLFKGGGLQWSTNIAYRTKASRKTRPNSEDNFIFNTVMIQHANITANVPEVSIEGNEINDKETAKKLSDMLKFNDKRNNFREMWKKLVLDYIAFGPCIAKVEWDNNWMGGTGPQRWIGECKMSRVDRKEFYPDPAIINLEERMQECSYIVHKFRKKLSDIKRMFPEVGGYITEEVNEDEYQNEGGDPQQAYLIEYWHKGFPDHVPPERAKELRERAKALEESGDTYKAQDYYDAANGNLEGIHVAYVSNNMLLEYIPYVYEDGLYPFAYTTRYWDENNPWGWGEIRNTKIPQILHNKADEIELEAISRQGLGGAYYTAGAITPKQLENIRRNSGKGGAWLEVDNVNMIRDREGVRVPGNLIGYKEHKQRMIETISQVTPIQQGMAPGANMPYMLFAA